MKTIKILLVSLLIIGQVSCSKDDDGGKTVDIIGKWTITEGQVESGSIVLDMGGMQIPVEVSGSFIDIDESNRLTFNEDQTFTSETGNITLELVLNVMGTMQTETFEASDILGQGTWELNGSVLKITNENGTTIPYHVDSINENTMRLSANVSDMSIDGTTNPMLDSMDINVHMTLKKV